MGLGVLLISISLTGCNNQVSSQKIESNASSTSKQEAKSGLSKVDKIEIFDFHSTRRCVSCLGMEKNAKETLDKYFKKELESGKITFQSINIEESSPEVATLVNKYQASGSSLFINAIKNGEDHIEQDANAWRYATQDTQFELYFKGELEKLIY
jgi:hypothetical protein